MPRVIHNHGITAQLMTTPHGEAYGLTSPDNGFEGYARKDTDGSWDQYEDLWALGEGRPIGGAPKLKWLMEGIARANGAEEWRNAA